MKRRMMVKMERRSSMTRSGARPSTDSEGSKEVCLLINVGRRCRDVYTSGPADFVL